MTKNGWAFLLALLGLHLAILENILFTAWPEMFSFPYLLTNRYRLYTDFIHPYPPLLTIILAGFYKVLGFNVLALKIASYLFILGSDVFIYLICKKLLKKESLAFLLLFPYLFLQSFLDGNMLWFDNALVLPIVASIYFLFNWLEKKDSKNLIWASVFLTAAVFIKQTAAIYFIVFLALYFWTRKRIVWPEIRKMLLPPIFAGSIFLVYLVTMGTLRDFWLWNFYYPLTFWSKFPGYQDFSLAIREKWVLALVLAPLLAILTVRRKIFKDKLVVLTLSFLAGSLLAVYPRFSFFHLQPAFAVSFIGFALIFNHLKKYWYLVFLYIVALLAIYPTLNYSLARSVRFLDENDQKIIEMVSALSTKEEKVLLPGLFSSAYVFSDRLPPKPWVDNFGWYWEVPGYSEHIIDKFEEDPPAKIFYKTPEEGNWYDLGVYTPQKLVNYMNEYYYRDSEPTPGIELWKRKN